MIIAVPTFVSESDLHKLNLSNYLFVFRQIVETKFNLLRNCIGRLYEKLTRTTPAHDNLLVVGTWPPVQPS